MDVFWEVHQGLPREAPGDSASTEQAYRLLSPLISPYHQQAPPRLLDVGCGPGSATFQLAQLSGGMVVAVDLYNPFLKEVKERAVELDCSGRVLPVRMSMNALGFFDESFDLIWSEGAIYIAGFEAGLSGWRRLLRPGGCLAVTEATWLKDDPPEPLRRFWDAAYPAMQDVVANQVAILRQGYRPVEHFTLPESAWWESYYNPMLARIHRLRVKYQGDSQALGQLDAEEEEIEIYRRYSQWYGYVFYIMQKD